MTKMTKIRSITKLYATLFIYLLYEYTKRVVQPVVVELAAECKQTA